ncbi:MAG TPA: DtxR family transcriptional regulator [Firmicutes bacterium]|nr:DtxR family transcriptional regulator [Bacillota bacterium]
MTKTVNLLHSQFDRDGEEALGIVWSAHEQGNPTIQAICERWPQMRRLIPYMERANLLRRNGDIVEFTDEGRQRAEQLVRRNRLAEVLLNQVLEVSPEGTAYTACLWEHMLTSEVTDNICTFLGHPRQCPHGKPIPPGECCRKMVREVTPLVQPLTSLRVGGTGKIVFITPRVHKRLDRLAALGIVPGTEISLKQKSPSYVIRCGETEVAIESSVAADIFVRETSPTK